MKTAIIIIGILLMAWRAFAGTYKVHYSIHGAGKDIIVNADSSDDARHSVEDMFPEGYVTGVRQIGK